MSLSRDFSVSVSHVAACNMARNAGFEVLKFAIMNKICHFGISWHSAPKLHSIITDDKVDNVAED